MEFRYELLVNVSWTVDDNRHVPVTGYLNGDLMLPVWRDTVDADDLEAAIGVVHQRHHPDARDGSQVPALSIGDVVVFFLDAGRTAYAFGHTGHQRVATPTNVERTQRPNDPH